MATYFVWEINLHFVHIMGLEFVLNIIVMHLVSLKYPVKSVFKIEDSGKLDIHPWKYANVVGIILIGITLLIYLTLGSIG